MTGNRSKAWGLKLRNGVVLKVSMHGRMSRIFPNGSADCHHHDGTKTFIREKYVDEVAADGTVIRLSRTTYDQLLRDEKEPELQQRNTQSDGFWMDVNSSP